MNKKSVRLILGLGMFMHYALGVTIESSEDPAKFIATCPEIQTCKPADGPKQNKSDARDNQFAYDCYRYIGQTDLANQAAIATSKCLAIYGFTNASVIKEPELKLPSDSSH